VARPRDNRKVEIKMSRENAANNRLSRKFRTPTSGATPPPARGRSPGGVARLDTPFRCNVASARSPKDRDMGQKYSRSLRGCGKVAHLARRTRRENSTRKP
jgi:hypothetical protein